jgi:ureidoglycolate dehydrogenase (NAD+)
MTKVYQPEVLKAFFNRCFSKLKVPSKIYAPVVDGLIQTSLRGVDSHGVRLIPHYVKEIQSGRINIHPKFNFKKTSPSTGIFDANDTFGITASVNAMEKAIKLARKNGIGAVTVIHSSHFGAAAIYTLAAAKNDMIGFACTDVDSFVVPYGGKKPFLGTNAISYSAPCEGEEPFCLDMATSTISANKMLTYVAEGKPFEPGWVVDANGNPTTDQNAEAHLSHFGGYKGYGIATVVEIFTSILTGSNYGPNITPMFSNLEEKRDLGHFMMAIDISRFQDISTFKKRMKAMMDDLRKQEPGNNFDKVQVANDPQKEAYKTRIKEGIPITEIDYKNYIEMAKNLHISDKMIQSFVQI